MYSACPVNRNDWFPTSKAAPQLASIMKLSDVRGAPPRSSPLLSSMKAVKSVLKKMKPGTSHEKRAPGKYLSTSASLSKLIPPMSAIFRRGPVPTVQPLNLEKLRIGYHSP